MKLLRYGPAGQEKPGSSTRTARSAISPASSKDIDGEHAVAGVASQRLKGLDPASLPLVGGQPAHRPLRRQPVEGAGDRPQLSPPRAGGRHADPDRADLFLKAPSSICGPDDDVIIPKGSQKTDYEVELAIVIGTDSEIRLRGRTRRTTSPGIAS